MSDLYEDLKKLVDKASMEQIMTPAALKTVTNALDRIESVEEQLDRVTMERDAHSDTLSKNSRHITELNDQIGKLTETLDSYTERMRKVRELEIRSELADQRVADHKEMVALVFRSPVYRERVTRNASGSVSVPSDHYTTPTNESEDTTIERSED